MVSDRVAIWQDGQGDFFLVPVHRGDAPAYYVLRFQRNLRFQRTRPRRSFDSTTVYEESFLRLFGETLH